MLAAHFCIRTIAIPTSWNQTNATPPIASASFLCSPIRCSIRTRRRRPLNSILISCNSFPGSSRPRSSPGDDPDHEFLEASLLVPETVSHYRMLKKGFQETKWQSSRELLPFLPKREPMSELLGPTFLRSFQSPTIFLKISCDGDFLLPILVGDYAIERIIEALWGDDSGDSPDLFQFVTNVVEKLGYEVRMVRITDRVMNTYFAKLYIGKPGESDILSVDARPSDAINLANRCKAPIYVNKQIVLADAVRIGRVHDRKPSYDVFLDSAADGPDLLSTELELVRNIELAVKEERYDDAAMWRDKLMKLRNSQDDH
ncbi:hypothetical protein SLE2022_009360 [Rubroshorea leprosula]